ncbi:MAG TPA: NTP transferase domain-containing protein [Gemmatimonadota bacterium]|nr:NTP transferase domain-containing protein [Gemmatimonadota bacterium]
MSERPLAAVILAAGQGTRMKSEIVKVLHPLAGRQMIRHVIEAVRGVGADRLVCVVGYQADRVRAALQAVPRIDFALQEEQRGTGHALRCGADALEGFDGDVVVCCGDTPLLTAGTLREVVEVHRRHGVPATLLTAELDDPAGYGRVATDQAGCVERIVEERDADEYVRSIRLVNTGVYCFHWPTVRPLLDRLDPANAQGEQYLTDVMGMLAAAGTPGLSIRLEDPVEMTGVNDRAQLAGAERVLRDRIRRRLMEEGVTFLAPETTLVDAEAAIGPDTVLYPGVLIEGTSTVGAASVVGPFTRIVDSHVGRGVELEGWNYIVRTTVPNGSIVKAYVRQGAD